ncbi:MAG: ABC transporter permease [Gammaproteobacteria bacterium]|nr:ABC transporter permease [Gammaproteobacteria bacterium]
MINLAVRDILYAWGKFIFTGLGLGLLIGVTFTMAGVYRGKVNDAEALLKNSGADLWLVQKNTLGPFAEPSKVHDHLYREIFAIPGVAQAVNVTYVTMQVRHRKKDIRTMVVGVDPGVYAELGQPQYLIAGRQITRNHYEAIADLATGFKLGEHIKIRRNYYTIVGLSRRMVATGGDPMIFIPLKDAQDVQFLKDNTAIIKQRRRTSENPVFNRPGVPGLLDAVITLQQTNHFVNAILVQTKPNYAANEVAKSIRRWKQLQVYTNTQMKKILLGKIIAASAKQISMFLVILALVSAAIIAFIIYTLTLGKIREIAVLKLIGAKNLSIIWMILQQALALGIIGFMIGKIAATLWAPIFPKHIMLLTSDSAWGFITIMMICVLASIIAIRAALKVDPAEAI